MRLPARSHRLGLAAVAIVLLVVAQLGALVHEATVRHVRCSEHGELVEAAVVDAVTGRPDDVRLVGVEAGGASGDDHCALARSLRQQGAAPHAPAIGVAHVAIVAGAPLVMVPRIAARMLYLIAPKTSPPDRPASS